MERLTTYETAAILGYHVNHIRRLIKQGVISASKIGQMWFIERAEVERIRRMQTDGRLPMGTVKD